eukprot:TRINITY_DN22375_c0_g1_i1.p2 TRINITY_DN22375_c0_g1~~TRINITY_DN22375_c0_g1_i1.p2  ORF type:complete len:458 (+),score=182.95 TRINITY_DN22375_c0_g1_i1:98-1375(+)
MAGDGDDDLDTLLDDALQTYDQTQQEEVERDERRERERQEREERERKKREKAAGGAGGDDDPALAILEQVMQSLNGAPESEMGEEERKLQQLVQQGISLMRNDGGDGDETQLLENCLGLLDSISKEFGDSEGGEAGRGENSDFVAQLKNTLAGVVKGMDEGGEGSAAGNDEELQRLCAQLLQPEILAKPFRELCSKYPEWLEKNGGQLPAEELARYKEQHEVLQQVVAEYDKAKPATEAEAAPAAAASPAAAGAPRVSGGDPTVSEVPAAAAAAAGPPAPGAAFNAERVQGLIEKLQGLGQPPAELVQSADPLGLGGSAPPAELQEALRKLQLPEGSGDSNELAAALSALQQGGMGDLGNMGELKQLLDQLAAEQPAAAAAAAAAGPAAAGAPRHADPAAGASSPAAAAAEAPANTVPPPPPRPA